MVPLRARQQRALPLLATLAGCLLLVRATTIDAAAAPTAPADLVLVHLTDLHSNYERYPALLATVAGIVRAADAPAVILVGGDTFEAGNVLARRSAGELDLALLAALRELAPVVLTLGNHEADVTGSYPRVIALLRAAGVEVVGSILDRASHAALAPATAYLDVAGVGLLVFGLSPPYPDVYPADLRPALELPDPAEWLPDALRRELSAATPAPLRVVLSHAGTVADFRMLDAVPDATLVLGGHDHVLRRESRGATLYLQGGAFAQQVGVVRVQLGAGCPSFSARAVAIDPDGATDRELAARLEELSSRLLTAVDREVLGTLERSRTLPEAAGWAVESLRAATSADVALLNHTSFGSGLERGPLPRWRFDLFLRFDNTLEETRIDGAELARVLAFAAMNRDAAAGAEQGDFVYASAIEADRAGSYRLVTSAWVAAHAAVYLGGEGFAFTPVADLTTKGILRAALRERAAAARP